MEVVQRPIAFIRNICILAHVDHGKTTMADCLIATNKIISTKQVGSLRLLDSREDEQERMITMKSSAISLHFNKYTINLIDSPGHIDFSHEVSSALRLSDGALLIVDAIEGVCMQTLSVIRQAWKEQARLILVINKLDKLLLQSAMSSEEIENKIIKIIEQVNAIMSNLIATDYCLLGDEKLIQQMEEKFYFSPEKLNVLFASAIDGWGFSLESIWNMIQVKLGINDSYKNLWGKKYYYPSKKAILDLPLNSNHKSTFSSIIIESLLREYKKIEDDKTLRNKLKEKLSMQLPIGKVIFESIVSLLPSPCEAQKYRLQFLIPQLYLKEHLENPEITKIRNHIENCGSAKPTILYTSKLVPINKLQIDDMKDKILNKSNENSSNVCFVTFTRIFSGTLQKGDELYIIPSLESKVPVEASIKIEHIYTFTGLNLKSIEKAEVGSIVAIGGIEKYLYKTSTLSSIKNCFPFIPLVLLTKPIVKVAIAAVNVSEMPILIDGLKQLDKSDPSVQVIFNETGEVILKTCGEVHLQKCLKDLNDDYCRINLKVSEPIVSFREAITNNNVKLKEEGKFLSNEEKQFLYAKLASLSSGDTKNNVIFDISPDKKLAFEIRSFALPFKVVYWLMNNSEIIKEIKFNNVKGDSFKKGFNQIMEECGMSKKQIKLINGYLISFGPKFCGPNLLVNLSVKNSIMNYEGNPYIEKAAKYNKPYNVIINEMSEEEISNAIKTGFNLATLNSPLIEEQMMGACFVCTIKSYEELKKNEKKCESKTEELESEGVWYGSKESMESKEEKNIQITTSGHIISIIKDLCRYSFLNSDPRIVEGIYKCSLQITSENMGKFYSLISKRRGKVISDDILGSSNIIILNMKIPVAESFGFASEFAKYFEGTQYPQLEFNGWEIIPDDPFFTSKTAEEQELYGNQKFNDNIAKIYINKIRKQKGLLIDVKVVKFADKQKTLKNK